MNLAAITAALCAGPDAHADPAKRYWSTIVAGVTYVALGLGAGFATVLVTVSPPLLIGAVAGLALLGSLAGALSAALDDPAERLPAIVTFAVAASGIVVFGIGAPFWALMAGGVPARARAVALTGASPIHRRLAAALVTSRRMRQKNAAMTRRLRVGQRRGV